MCSLRLVTVLKLNVAVTVLISIIYENNNDTEDNHSNNRAKTYVDISIMGNKLFHSHSGKNATCMSSTYKGGGNCFHGCILNAIVILVVLLRPMEEAQFSSCSSTSNYRGNIHLW